MIFLAHALKGSIKISSKWPSRTKFKCVIYFVDPIFQLSLPFRYLLQRHRVCTESRRFAWGDLADPMDYHTHQLCYFRRFSKEKLKIFQESFDITRIDVQNIFDLVT